ncbi:bifunctional 4-hydroxy-2-oxoglutarate aldolase/2-dehydro-3-deoxy-phosphogluconate aldolase [Congregibacter variabilis]|uniref:2-dehydro-3-deoxy-phosphogluconate aldolase n=1 Tax=Congregibacter variabilis TaxID=3081200 RepID=A0ABZ0I696_9GAMM|nr:bifunctional 4-hydroxy-2-oxoglutarate aldolase/2-dehydro-3-deoxy-phosphogluconate aldolase [Congregibacter sp. IMCC43200]
MRDSRDILSQAPVVPVLAIENLDHAIPLARALVDGGIPVLEVTLRTPAGLPAIRAISEAVPDAIVGAGTVINARDFEAAVDAGSRFVVTPGLTQGILDAAADSSVPLIPGVATVSELMRALDHGIDCLKFFPAEASGGAAALKAFAGPFPNVDFCPTGGIGLHNIDDYLALRSVITVGGSWLTPSALLAAEDWAGVTKLAREAVDHVTAFRTKS